MKSADNTQLIGTVKVIKNQLRRKMQEVRLLGRNEVEIYSI